jgi:predicted nucleotidyltransferase component of viral defense system
MRPLRMRLEEARKRTGRPWRVLEEDYMLSWVLAGIGETEVLRNELVFKGGTALKKCYFGDYRFSEDLDFSVEDAGLTGESMEAAIRAACERAEKVLEDYAPVSLICERYSEREPHPGEQEAFVVRARLPWHREHLARVMVEVTVDEKILRPTESRAVIHDYGEPLDAIIRVYSLEEIMAEKLRAILQHVERLRERGWGRSRARDYYDLWRVLGRYQSQLDTSDFCTFLSEKCAHRSVSFRSSDDFFQEPMLSHVERTWEQWLGPLVSSLPPFAAVARELRPQIAVLLGESP